PGDRRFRWLLGCLGVVGGGFCGAPLGGVRGGYLGDRFGRKRSLLATLMLMAVSTVAIGLLPTHAQAGVIAPILLVLMRVLQGIAVGGEWGGAGLLAGEPAPGGKRTFFASFAHPRTASGLALSSLASAAIRTPAQDNTHRPGSRWTVP
ncbi:MFS transporter, partial [Burkholderia contaminans]